MLALLLWLLSSVVAVMSQCSDHVFLGCVLRLKAQRVPMERNIMNLVFNIKSEAELLHTCRAYSSILPCFRERIKECGDEKQRRLLNDVGKMLMYLCSPFSLKRQRTLIDTQKCVSGVMAMPASTGCKLQDMPEGEQVLKCKKHCAIKQMDFLCTMKSWISEQNVCALKDIHDKCGIVASDFYRDMQKVIFEPEFPVICEYDNDTSAEISLPRVNSIFIESLPTTAATTTTTLSSQYFNQSYPEKKFVVMVTPPSLFTSTTMRTAVWTKSPIVRKMQYNKESWRKKGAKTTDNMVVVPTFTKGIASISNYPYATTQPPLVSSSPKSYKVITLLKSLLPENLPSKLTSLFENSIEKHSFFPEDHYHTPGMAETAVTEKTTTKNYTVRRKATTKWKPWYLGGPVE